MNEEKLKGISKTNIAEAAKNLSDVEVNFLIEALSQKDDKLRYNAFLLLQANSQYFPHVYEHWGTLEKKLTDSNSYQRSIGLMLIAENVRWDSEGKFGKILNRYLECCSDEKFITARQAIQGLANVVEATSSYDDTIKQALTTLTMDKYKPNQQKLLQKDAAAIIRQIEKQSN
jgi:hypothetical protein